MVGWYGKPIGLLFVLDQRYLIYTKLGASFSCKQIMRILTSQIEVVIVILTLNSCS